MTDSKPSLYRRRAGHFAGLSLVMTLLASSTLATAQQPVAEPAPATPPAAQSQPEENGEPYTFSKFGAQVVDVLVLRPTGAVATLGGVAAFAVTSPFVLVSSAVDVSTSWDIFVVAPLEYTVDRPLGDL